MGCWLLVAEPEVYVASATFPCDIGCPVEGSHSQNIHNFISAITLPMTTLGLVLQFFNKGIATVRRVGWLVLAGVFNTLYSLALVPDFAGWRVLLQRLAEGILYGCLCLVRWQLLSAQNDLTAERVVNFFAIVELSSVHCAIVSKLRRENKGQCRLCFLSGPTPCGAIFLY